MNTLDGSGSMSTDHAMWRVRSGLPAPTDAPPPVVLVEVSSLIIRLESRGYEKGSVGFEGDQDADVLATFHDCPRMGTPCSLSMAS